ncbi:hypothetical protein EYZ11_000328 [Aspergillus tanneri]|uniref:Uncharacterized protein n=1 Tax=Aspergillus tanneri TaxID=1220188 RepID=A0A4S3JX86_9EURO|nr:hypothetical protein EYZ11_000328 [Aspergillus tanneri]
MHNSGIGPGYLLVFPVTFTSLHDSAVVGEIATYNHAGSVDAAGSASFNFLWLAKLIFL